MTPAQRQYDIDLVVAMQKVAKLVEPRSRKMSDMLKVAAGRIDALSASVQIDQPLSVITPIQPASTPDEANKPNP
jgi:hypothetical protein